MPVNPDFYIQIRCSRCKYFVDEDPVKCKHSFFGRQQVIDEELAADCNNDNWYKPVT